MDKKRIKIVYKNIEDLIPYVNNPRNNEKAVDMVAGSIKEFGFLVPMVIDVKNGIVAGHTRLEGAKKVGYTEVPCIMAEDLTEGQIKAFRIADNKTAEFSEWDLELLGIELEGLDGEFTGFSDNEIEDLLEQQKEFDEEEISLSKKSPIYEIRGEEPEISELYDNSRTEHLIKEVEEADIPEEIKRVLKLAAYRHTVFNYEKMAEFYAHASKEVQELMENSALVIIDFDKAIENGYIRMSKTLEDLIEEDGNI